MSQFHSLRLYKGSAANHPGEHSSGPAQAIAPTVLPQDAFHHTDALFTVSTAPQTGALPVVSAAETVQHTVTGPLYNGAPTQSLVSALQATLQPVPARPLVVIPGARKRPPLLVNTTVKPKRLPHNVRLVLVMGALFGIFLSTLFSLTPLRSGQSGIALMDGAVYWAEAQQANWIGLGRIVHNQPAPATTAQTYVAPMMLPKSQYIAIARQDALNAGIPPDAFVRQINTESGFNPYAVSPVGAVGIAQFMPATAATMGVDPYDPISALSGAARFMAQLNNEFYGDYAKALAAYNAGSGNVIQAVNIGGANWLSYMTYETQHYVHTIMGY